MNSSNQGNSQGNSQIKQQGTSYGNMQSGEQNLQSDTEQGFDLADQAFILGEVRRVDSVRNRQSADQEQNAADTTGKVGA
ncbi:MAG TPA: hypothetical protein DCW29_01495 [Janthinobacterium sp.]|nr:hypothetical protein [Janthinobacterium sp.]